MNTNIPYYITRLVTPAYRRDEAIAHGSVSIGISLDNSHYTTDRVDGVFKWIERHFSQCLIFIGDYLYANTLQLFFSSSATIDRKVLTAVETFQICAAKHIHSSNTHFNIITLSELSRRQDFQSYLKQLHTLYTNDVFFRRSIDRTAFAYLSRKSAKSALAVPSDTATALCIKYLLDEVAFYCQLTADGWFTEVYPGPEMHVLKEIINGRIPEAPKQLKDRVFFEIEQADSQPPTKIETQML